MIACYWEWYIWNNYITLPYEINNSFFWPLNIEMNNWGMINYWFKIRYNDFSGDVIISPEKLDQHLSAYETLEKNLDNIIKIVPLPKKVWTFDWYYYPWFIEYIDDKIDREIYGEKDFTKQDMLLLIDLIKIKILEAKEKNVALIFSGD